MIPLYLDKSKVNKNTNNIIIWNTSNFKFSFTFAIHPAMERSSRHRCCYDCCRCCCCFFVFRRIVFQPNGIIFNWHDIHTFLFLFLVPLTSPYSFMKYLLAWITRGLWKSFLTINTIEKYTISLDSSNILLLTNDDFLLIFMLFWKLLFKIIYSKHISLEFDTKIGFGLPAYLLCQMWYEISWI